MGKSAMNLFTVGSLPIKIWCLISQITRYFCRFIYPFILVVLMICNWWILVNSNSDLILPIPIRSQITFLKFRILPYFTMPLIRNMFIKLSNKFYKSFISDFFRCHFIMMNIRKRNEVWVWCEKVQQFLDEWIMFQMVLEKHFHCKTKE